jgi:hypothetical protein
MLYEDEIMSQAVGRAKTNHGVIYRSKASPFRKSIHSELKLVELRDALSDLYRLLEDYAPSWYTQEYREKAEGALHFAKS